MTWWPQPAHQASPFPTSTTLPSTASQKSPSNPPSSPPQEHPPRSFRRTNYSSGVIGTLTVSTSVSGKIIEAENDGASDGAPHPPFFPAAYLQSSLQNHKIELSQFSSQSFRDVTEAAPNIPHLSDVYSITLAVRGDQ